MPEERDSQSDAGTDEHETVADGVSVVLSTPEWTVACEELATQIGPDDPVVAAATDTPAEIVVAGEPTGCSAKCNALAAGLERATGRDVVCTDADFEHGDDWLDTVVSHREAAPPGYVVSSVPVLVSERPLTRGLEGPGAISAVLTAATGAAVWGGTMAFRHDEVDLDRYVTDLRRTVSDDALLTEQVEGVTSVRSLARETPVSGTLADTLSRQVRWAQTGRYFDPGGLAAGALVPVFVVAGTLVAPFWTVPLVTAAAGLAYAALGVRRWSFLLTVVGYFLVPVLLVYGLTRTEFVWTGRRYRWTDRYEVEVLDREV